MTWYLPFLMNFDSWIEWFDDDVANSCLTAMHTMSSVKQDQVELLRKRSLCLLLELGAHHQPIKDKNCCVQWQQL